MADNININLTPVEANAIVLGLWQMAKIDDRIAKTLGGQANIDKRKQLAEFHRTLADKIMAAREGDPDCIREFDECLDRLNNLLGEK
jgi:hypothetical protein